MNCRKLCERACASSLAFGALGFVLLPVPVVAGNAAGHEDIPVAEAQQPAADLDAMREEIRTQFRKMEEQTKLLEKQRRELEQQRQRLETLEKRLARLGEPQPPPVATLQPPPAAGSTQQPAASPEEGSKPPLAVAGRPQQETPAAPPPVELLADVGGVLTRRGVLVVEPQFEYSYDTSSRFFFNGVEIVDAVLIGIIEVDEAQRKIFTESVNFRYGITNRLEADVSVPWVYRHDRSSRQEIGITGTETSTTNNTNLGDIEFGLHYQFNQGLGGWPFFVGNLKVKTDTGEGPFDIKRDERGIEKETATGSGFWAVEPSVTVIYPSDPAVLFGNIGYLYSFEEDVGKNIGVTSAGFPIRADNVSPGGSLRASFGAGFALNDQLSFSLGYEHNWIAGTDQTISFFDSGVGRRVSSTSESDDFQVGSLLFGLSYAITDKIGFNINVAAGVTEDAPDARVTVRVPISFDLFK